MRIRLLLFITLLLNLSLAYSQSVTDKNFLDVLIGPSFPAGEYAKKDITNSSSGFAKAGEFLKISYTHLLQKDFGLSAAIHGQRNPLNTKALEASLSQADFYETAFAGSTLNPTPAPYPSSRYGNWKFDKHSWLVGSFLLGGYGQLAPQRSNRLLLTAKAMAGVVYAHAPAINGKSTSDTAAAQITRSSSSAFGFAWSIATGIKLQLSNKIYLLTQAEYFGTNKILFKDVKVTFTSAHYSNGFPTSANMQTATGNEKQKIVPANLNFGIGIWL
jgi:hypothetical protein